MAMTYAATDAAIAATIIQKDLRTGNRNSADMQDMDSIPTKSQGEIMSMPRIWTRGEPPEGEKNGRIDASPPSLHATAAPKQATSPAAKTRATAICTAAATRRLAMSAATMPMATVTMAMSPRQTLNPATWYLNPK